jgi:hypothetical protein
MKKFTKAVAGWVLAIAVLGIGLVLGIGFCTTLSLKGFTSGDTAGWAQAIGGVLSVAVTISIYLYATQREERERRRQQEALKAGLLSLSDRASILIESVENGKLYTSLIQVHLRNHIYQEYVKYIKSEIQSIESILAGVTLDKLAEADIVDSGLYMRQALNGFDGIVSSGFQIDPQSGIPVNETKVHFQHMKNFVKLAQEILMGKKSAIDDIRRRLVEQRTANQ